MATCATVDVSTGAITATATSIDSCTGVALLSPEEFASSQSVSAWALSLSDGALIGVAILGVWALAWSFRAIAIALQSTDEGTQS